MWEADQSAFYRMGMEGIVMNRSRNQQDMQCLCFMPKALRATGDADGL
jgi:hypothetical protein